jgi:hypothetical protein
VKQKVIVVYLAFVAAQVGWFVVVVVWRLMQARERGASFVSSLKSIISCGVGSDYELIERGEIVQVVQVEEAGVMLNGSLWMKVVAMYICGTQGNVERVSMYRSDNELEGKKNPSANNVN